MPEAVDYGPAEKAFEKELRALIGDRPVRVWLTISRAGRLDTLFAAGDAQGKPIRHFDHAGGFYLLGENITPDLLDPIHRLLLKYCQAQHRVLRANPLYAMNWQYRHFGFRTRKKKHELVMHIPFSV